jgi:hypothetical protein
MGGFRGLRWPRGLLEKVGKLCRKVLSWIDISALARRAFHSHILARSKPILDAQSWTDDESYLMLLSQIRGILLASGNLQAGRLVKSACLLGVGQAVKAASSGGCTVFASRT